MYDHILARKSTMSSWNPIPGSVLEMRLRHWHGVSSLLFRKNKIWIYTNVFSFYSEQSDLAFCLVSKLYHKYLKAWPAEPPKGGWIHTVPIHDANLSADELGLIHELIQYVYWSIVRVVRSAD
jgi:hypothetical protein